MILRPGDRVRWETVDDDGLPLVRYGFVGGANGDRANVTVMFDDDIKSDTEVAVDQLEQVNVLNIELRLHGSDLLDNPSLRQGLVNLWSAEADRAGIEVVELRCLGTGVRDAHNGYALAELCAGSEHYVLRARHTPLPDIVSIKPDHPYRHELWP